ncbi:CAF17-like 4Fe-4S cluster assembly/insertion protein YgfZ [Meridianimarinicoccus sp. RP-17]|uniref:CAF17-like 4Fe-4S cluster assembly/insertion protein YgfZ n=1 Tax=Meridianimarinicoccus zhengii TaxID=2056810 RepID=UPI000DAC4FD1|nr:folate-binding protein YgfZ [Phycocomes zhengii]
MTDPVLPPRHVLRITGADRAKFLQGLVTSDVDRLSAGAVWTAMLTPQGKYLADFFLVDADDAILLDVAKPLAAGLAKRLSMYKLRADVRIADAGLTVTQGLGEMPAGAVADPRHPALGWRAYGDGPAGGIDPAEWNALRVDHVVPETGVELVPDRTFILEAGFDRLHGVDFRKGCYVGQEVTARMRHKTELRKGLVRVAVTGGAPVGTPVADDAGRTIGTLFTQAGGFGLAHLRFDRAAGPMSAGSATLRLAEPATQG